MNRKDSIFQLIKSLTRSEKRFFKLSASVHEGEKNYLVLFDVIDSLKEYDEKKIRRKISKKKFASNLSFEKHYLYNLILKSLNDYHAGYSVSMRLRSMLNSAEILYHKALYEQAEEIIKKIKSTAGRHEKYTFLFEAILWERRLKTDRYLQDDNTDERVQQSSDEREHAIRMLNKISEGLFIQDKLFLWAFRTNNLRTKEQEDKMGELLDSVMPDTLYEKYPYDSLRYIYNSYIIYYKLTGQTKKSLEYAEKLLKHIEAHPDQVKEFPLNYASAFNNVIVCMMDAGQYDQMIPMIKRFRSLPPELINRQSEDVHAMVFRYSFNLEIGLYLDTGDFEKAISIVPEIETGIEKYREKIPSVYLNVFYTNIALIYFFVREYKKALYWLNKTLNNPETGPREDILSSAKIFNLILHYEMGNRELLEYIVKSTYRFLLKRERLYKVETEILHFLRRLSKIENDRTLNEKFRELKSRLEKLYKDPFEKQAFSYFNYVLWLESKIENKDLADVVRQAKLLL